VLELFEAFKGFGCDIPYAWAGVIDQERQCTIRYRQTRIAKHFRHRSPHQCVGIVQQIDERFHNPTMQS
jgi:hypothetical protein